MAVHAMSKAELDQVERHEQDTQHEVLALADAGAGAGTGSGRPGPPGSPGLAAAAAALDRLHAEVGPLAAGLIRTGDPVSELWRAMFAGPDAIYLRLLQVVRLADGFAPWPDPGQLAIGGAGAPIEALVAAQVGRSAALTARWQRTAPADPGELAAAWAGPRYGLGGQQREAAMSAAAATGALLAGGWGERRDQAVPYARRLALHHRLRMLFVEYAGLILLAYLQDAGGLPRIDRAAVRGGIGRRLASPAS